LVLTLNYDRLVERAAVQAGRQVQTLGVEDIHDLLNDGLVEPDDSLRVLHLHGSLDDRPEELVLDAATYASRADNQHVRDLFAALLASYNLCIIGSSFEEHYLASVLQARRPSTPRHVIVCDAPAADRILNGSAAVSHHVHNVLVCDYPCGDHGVLDDFCERLVYCEPAPSASTATVATAAPEPDPLYEARRFIEPSKLASHGPYALEVSLALGQLQVLDEDDLRAERRAVVIGGPGSGKSLLLANLAALPSAGERSVLVRMRDVRQVVGEPDLLLAAWVTAGRVLDGGGPVPITGVSDGSVRVHLILDGLDELPRDDRARVAAAIVRVGEALPEQRLTVSSRPSSALESFNANWRQFELLCDLQWRPNLLERAGTDEDRLATQLRRLYPVVEPLLRVPFFLRGMLKLLQSGSIPKDGLDLALGLLRLLLAQDEQLRALGTSLDDWLQRVALTMLLNGSSALSTADLGQLGDRSDLGDAGLVTDVLVSRSLLLESSDRYAFQHRVFAEALVAEFLLDQPPEDWLDILAPRAGGHSMLREDWVGVSDLLLPRSSRWRAALAERNPRAAARCTPPNAPVEERRHAGQLLWDRARNLEVWIDGFASPGVRSDGEVIGSLMQAGGLKELEVEVRDALTHRSRFQRSNAVDVVTRAGVSDAEGLLRRVLADDPDPVVRKGGAYAALRLKLNGLVGMLERRAVSAEDEAEAEDLAAAALALTPQTERLELAIKLLAAGIDKVRDTAAMDDLAPATRIRWLAVSMRGRKDEPWRAREQLDVIVTKLTRPTKRQAAHVAFVAAVAQANSERITDFLRRHRHSAVGLIEALEEDLVDDYEIIDLLLAVGSRALRRQGASQQVLEVVDSWEQARARPVPQPSRVLTPSHTAKPIGLAEVMAIDDRDRRLRLLLAPGERLSHEVPDASDDIKRQVIAELDQLWGEQDLREFVEIDGNKVTIRHWAAAILLYGPRLEWQLTAERWVQTALCGWLFPPQLTWLRQQADTERVNRALQQNPSPRGLADLAELSHDRDLPLLLKSIMQIAPEMLPKDRLERIISRLAQAHRPDLLSQLAGHGPATESLVGPYLAASGDLTAQRGQIKALIERLRRGESIMFRETDWLTALEDSSLFDLLTEAISLAAVSPRGDESPLDSVLAPLQAAAARVDPLAAIAFYDQLIADRPWPGAQFLIHRRDALVQGLILEPGQHAAAKAARELNLPTA